ncbi:MAG: hypothetical protein P1U34_03535 [Coxiellaceae bacterium]|nr:hypothetical protein [Coxiellaceae bacterium]
MRRRKMSAAEQAAALKAQAKVAITQATAAWENFQHLAKHSGHHFGDYHGIVLEIAELSERFSIAFTQGKIKTEHAIKAKLILGATRELATKIYEIESKHTAQYEYFAENATMWIEGLEDTMFIMLGKNRAKLENLDDIKFGTDPLHPPVADHAGFAYGLLRGFLSHLLSSGNFLALKEISNKYSWNPSRAGLLNGIAEPINKIKANNAMQACLAACQAYCESLALAAIEEKVTDTTATDTPRTTTMPSPLPDIPPSPVPTSSYPSVNEPPSDDDVDSPFEDEFTDDESDGDTDNDIEEFKGGLFHQQHVAKPASPPAPPTPPNTPVNEIPARTPTPTEHKAATASPVAMTDSPPTGLFASVLPPTARPRLPGLGFFTSSSWVPPAALLSTTVTQTDHATLLLANIERYLQQRSTKTPGWMSNALADFDARQQCYDAVCAYILDVEDVDDAETSKSLITMITDFIRLKAKPFKTMVPIFGTQNFHDHLESLCVALEDDDGISIENLQKTIKRMHPAIEKRATEASLAPSPTVSL